MSDPISGWSLRSGRSTACSAPATPPLTRSLLPPSCTPGDRLGGACARCGLVDIASAVAEGGVGPSGNAGLVAARSIVRP